MNITRIPEELRDARMRLDMDIGPRIKTEMLYDFYVCGPMSGYPERNFPLFYFATAFLREMGYAVCNPAELHGPVEKLCDKHKHHYLRRDIAHQLRCRGLVRLPGWEQSEGASIEVAVAKAIRQPMRDFEILFPGAIAEFGNQQPCSTSLMN